MRVLGWVVLALAPVFAAVMSAPGARAALYDQRTIVTFSGPVEVPGQVLPAGTYVFRLMDSESDRNIVQVFNRNESHCYGTFLTIPDYRMRPNESGKTVVTFEERSAGSPEAVRAWFYPSTIYGHMFVYPKAKAVSLAAKYNQPVPAMPNELESNTRQPAKSVSEPQVMAMKKAPLKAETPSGGESEVAEAFTPPPAPSATTTPARLPKTAGSMPLIALMGLLSVGVAASLHRIAGRV